jgi:hypothetical protein
VDIEQVVYPGHLKKGLHPRVDMDKFHVAARLPDAAKAPGQFAQAIAVNEIHALEIDQELLVAVAGEDMNKVAQLRSPRAEPQSQAAVLRLTARTETATLPLVRLNDCMWI